MSARDFYWPRSEWSEWTVMPRYLFLLQKPTRNSDNPSVSRNRAAKTIMSLSNVRSHALLWPCTVSLSTRRSIMVSSAAWMNDWSSDTWKFLLVSMPCAFRRSGLLMPLLQICLLINENNSFLLWIHVLHESASQLGIGVLPSLTIVRGPFRSVVAHMLSNCPMVGNYPKASIRWVS